MSLTKEKRDSLPESSFAVPGKRALPIHDAVHVRMAHNMLNKTSDLTEEERETAQHNILNKAKELGVDTTKWSTEASAEFMFIQSMAIELPDVKDHPNRTPFKGVLTKLNQPSDAPPFSTKDRGKRLILPTDVAEKALPSLMTMAIDFKNGFGGHDKKQKIGIITSATISGDDLNIEGFFYGADFPEEVKRIQDEKELMGFSFEAQVYGRPMGDGLVEITECVFTGAAVLYKDKAAYKTTSITANAEETTMTKEILDAIKALAESVAGVTKELAEVKAAASVQANSVMAMVKPHAEALHAAADGMEKAGIGIHEKRGHVAHLRTMANSMCAEAANGKLPHIYTEHDFYSAAADKGESKAVDVKANADMEVLKDQIAALTTKITDGEKARVEASAAPDRKTISPEIKVLLEKVGIEAGKDDGKVAVSIVDKALSEKGIPIGRRTMTEKLLMNVHGVIGENK